VHWHLFLPSVSIWKLFSSRPHFLTLSWIPVKSSSTFSGSWSDFITWITLKKSIIDWFINWLDAFLMTVPVSVEANLSFVEPGRRWTQDISKCYMVLLFVSSGASVGHLRVSFFLNHDWFACQLQRAEYSRKGSHKGPLFWMFPLSLQSIISNQMRPRRLRVTWFSRLLRHLARRRSGSILSLGTHTGSFLMTLCRSVAGHQVATAPWGIVASLAIKYSTVLVISLGPQCLCNKCWYAVEKLLSHSINVILYSMV